MSKEQEIGNLFRESLQGYQSEPPAGTWDAIAQDKTLLKFNRRKRMGRLAKFTAFPLAGLIAVIVISIALFPKPPKDESRAVATETATATIPAVTTPAQTSSVAPAATDGIVPTAPAPRQNTDIAATQPSDDQATTPRRSCAASKAPSSTSPTMPTGKSANC